jgi:hypothetical protein
MVGDRTPGIHERLVNLFETLNQSKIYGTCYGTTLEPPHLQQRSTGLLSIPRPDKHLTTIVDAVRSMPDKPLKRPYTVTELYEFVCRYFPPPHRPSNTLKDAETLRKILNNAYSGAVTRIKPPGEPPHYSITPPAYTPLYPADTDIQPRWMLYLRGLQNQSKSRTIVNTSQEGTQYVDAVGSSLLMPPETPESVQRAQRAVVAEPETTPLSRVKPRIHPETREDLSPDEIVFLTRVGLGMRRLLADYRITDSMQSYDTGLEVDVSRLQEEGYLDKHTLRRTYYSIPWQVADALGVPNLSNEGWGEITPAEGLPHRVAVTAAAALIAKDPDVEQVWTYADSWRGKAKAGELPEGNRGDVLGVAEDRTIQVVAEVETASGDHDKVGDTMEYLQQMQAAGVKEALLVTPTTEDLRTVMQRASESGYLELNTLPAESSKPSNWEDFCARNNVFGTYFDDIYTYRQLLRTIPSL